MQSSQERKAQMDGVLLSYVANETAPIILSILIDQLSLKSQLPFSDNLTKQQDHANCVIVSI